MEPLQDAKDKGLTQAQSSGLYIFYFSDPGMPEGLSAPYREAEKACQSDKATMHSIDHIESIGKPILLKGDEVLLNGLLAQSA